MGRIGSVGLSLVRGRIFRVSRYLMWCALVVSAAYGQEKPRQPEKLAYAVDPANVPEAVAYLKSGKFAAVHVDMIVRAGAVEAIPSLKEQFVRVEDPLLKAKIAGALVIFHADKDGTYWDFLVQYATPALESDAPGFLNYDAQGKSSSGPSPKFEAWMKAHNLSPSSELFENSFYMMPASVLLLGWTRDARAIPLLRRGLLSPNHQIVIAAAMGLAEIGDKESIPLIIDACKRAPADPAAVIAESLVYFDDAAAQSAVDQYIPKDRAKMYRDARAEGKNKPF
jgi:PBS lyase HEAT-like repeat